MNNNRSQPNTSQSNVYYIVDGSRKRRQIDPLNATQRGHDFSKRPAKPANGDGEILAEGQGRQQISKFREQISYVANAVVKDERTIGELSRPQRYEISGDEIIDDDTIAEEEYAYDSATASTTVTREQQQQQQRPPYYVVLNAPERQILTTVDPTTCTDVTSLQESLHHANNCILEILEQQRKLKHQNSILRTRYNIEVNRTDDFQKILLERNLRMKQIVSENVRWNVRYTRLKQHFGEEDVNAALGELAPK
uniref:Uncharacterized protein n=1 Tax=Panagrolaimus sp. PS1159 TaxID=55785 RepID=A0AC35FBJ6_9BILA